MVLIVLKLYMLYKYLQFKLAYCTPLKQFSLYSFSLAYLKAT